MPDQTIVLAAAVGSAIAATGGIIVSLLNRRHLAAQDDRNKIEQEKEHAAHQAIGEKVEIIQVMINSHLHETVRAAVAEAFAEGKAKGVEEERQREESK